MSHFRPLTALLLTVVAGCGPTRTAGTHFVSTDKLSILSIAQLPEESPVQLRTIAFDDTGEEYKIGKGRDFYLLPRDHTASFTVTAGLPKTGGLIGDMVGKLSPIRTLTLPVPVSVPLGMLTAGKTYELVRPTQGFEALLQGGHFSLVREKEKQVPPHS